MTAIQLLGAGTVLLIGACLQGTIGFGMNMLAAPLFALIDSQLLPAALLVATFGVTVPAFMTGWDHIDARGFGWAIAGRVPGGILGALAIVLLPATGIAILVAVSILVTVAINVWRRRAVSEREVATIADKPEVMSRQKLVVAGAASGFMGTTTTVGGPAMALIYAKQAPSQMRATLGAFFAAGLTLSCLSLFAFGQFAVQDVWLGLKILPFALVGWLISRPVTRKLDGANWLEPAVLTLCACAAVVLLVTTAL